MLPYGRDLNDLISIVKSATRETATVGDKSTVEFRTVLGRARDWLQAETPEYMWAEPTGASVLFAYISERITTSMLRGNLVAVLLIAGVLIVALRSVGLGTLSLVTNVVPILLSFGIWALVVRQVRMAAATVSATSLTIVVADTVHFLAKYLRARREKRYDRPTAIRYAFETVGVAIIQYDRDSRLGFGVLIFSAFRINAQMGLITMMSIVLALATDLLLLPALLMVGHRTSHKEPRTVKDTTVVKSTSPIPVSSAAAVAASIGAGAHRVGISAGQRLERRWRQPPRSRGLKRRPTAMHWSR